MMTGAQRVVGWCETAEGIHGTRLGVAARNQMRVDADGFHRYMDRI